MSETTMNPNRISAAEIACNSIQPAKFVGGSIRPVDLVIDDDLAEIIKRFRASLPPRRRWWEKLLGLRRG
jgi:hypothetical protein